MHAAGFNLSHFNTFLKVIPENERHSFTALYLSLANVAVFVAPLVAVQAGGAYYGFGPVLVVCGVLLTQRSAEVRRILRVAEDRAPVDASRSTICLPSTGFDVTSRLPPVGCLLFRATN